MTTANKPVTPPVPPQEMEIARFTKHVQETCRGFFDVILPSGMILRNLTLREKGDARWINFPSRQLPAVENEQPRYLDFVGFVNDQIRKRFQDQMLAALDRHFETMPPAKGQA